MGKYWDHQGTVKAQEKTPPWSCLVQPSKIGAIFSRAKRWWTGLAQKPAAINWQ